MSTLTLTHPAANEDWEKLLAFSQLVHPKDDPALFVHLYRERPDLSPEDHAMLVEEEQVIATCSLLPHHHYFGDSELEVGEIGLMGTHPDRRLEGHAERLLNHWLSVAKDRGYPYVYLYGIPRFYEKFGFAYAAPFHAFPALRMGREVLEPVMSPYRVRPLNAADVPVLQELYDMANCRTPMAEVRSPEYWTYRLGHTRQGGFGWWVAVDENNQPHGYVWADLAHARLREVVVGDDEAARAILQWMKWELAERKLPEFTAQVPLNQRFAQVARRMGAYTADPHTLAPGNWGAMVKVLRLQPVLEAMRPRLEERLLDSRYARAEVMVTLMMGDEAVSLRWAPNNQRLQVAPGSVGHEIKLPPACWGPVLTGYKAADEIHGLELSDPEKHLLRTLFAGGSPYIWDLEQSDAL